jgi:hypothetical protein
MSEQKVYITFKTFSRNPADKDLVASASVDSTYPLSMLRSVLLLNGISQLVPSSVGFNEFARMAIDGGGVSLPGIFSALVNQILDFYHFDRDILLLAPGFTRAGDHEYWFDKVKDPTTHQTVIFLKTSKLDGSTEVLQLAYMEPVPRNIQDIYYLLRRLRLPEINLQEIVDGIASNRDLVASLTAYMNKLFFHSKGEMGVMEVFLLLGQEKFKEWGLSEIVLHSKDLVPPQSERFHYPEFHLPSLPGLESLNGPGLIEALYILGFLGLADDISRSSPHAK